jgi:hypothetical protein
VWAAAATVMLAVLAASVVQWYAGDLLSRFTFTLFDFPETSFLTWNWTSFHLWRATLAAMVLLVVAVAAARLPRHGPAVLVGTLVAVNVAAVTTATTEIARPLSRDLAAYSDLRDSTDLRNQHFIAVDWNIPWTLRLSHFYWASNSRGTMFDARWQIPPRGADLVVLAWAKNVPASHTWRHAPADWRIVATRRTPQGDWVAWAGPSTSHDPRHTATRGGG